MPFNPCASELFYKRGDESDPRWGDEVQIYSPTTSSDTWILRGYPDDEGIQLNGGRLGARHAPDQIRKYFYKTCKSSTSPALADQGNLQTQRTLEQRHQTAQDSLLDILKKGHRVVSLGGGHDYGYPDGAGFLKAFEKQNPVVVNFDAHLDVRPLNRGLSSGTPFYRLLTQFPSFEFYEIGIQAQCNSESHIRWCLEKKGKILTWKKILEHPLGIAEAVMEFLKSALSKNRPLFLSLDIDVFSSAYAPGCSQSWATGMEPNAFAKILSEIQRQADLRVFGIYEVSPPLDTDDRTSKMAALWLNQVLAEVD